MNKLLLVLFLAVFATVCSGATIVCSNLIDSIGVNYAATSVKFTPISKVPQAVGDSTVMPSVVQTGVTNGQFTIGLVAGNTYLFQPLPPNSFVPAITVLVPNGSNFYTLNETIAFATNRNVFLWTNAYPIQAGTNIIFTTNGSLLVINSSAAGGSTINTNPFVLTNDTRALVLTNSNNLIGAASIDFNTGLAAATHREGRVFYDTNSHTLSYYLDRSNVTPNLGFEMLVRVLNTSGATISNGAPVTLSTQGNGENPRVVLAQSTTNLTSAYDCIGIATEDILQGEEGIVAQGGIVHDVNTDGWQNNSTVYVSTNAGVLTTNPPPAGYEKIRVGVVAKSGSNSGHILVAVRQSLKLSDIANVGTAAYSNSTAFVGTNAWATTNALKADLANLTIAATNSGAYVAATNGTAYNLNISSGNGGGLTNVLASYVSGTLTNNTTGSAASLSSVITAAALASNTPFAPGSLLMANNGVNQNWSTNLLWNSSVLTIRDSLITNTWTLTSTGTVWGVSGARAEASMVVNTNSTLYGINTISTVSAFTASVGGASYAFDTADFRHSSGAQDLGRTSIPWGTGYFRNVSVRTNLFVTNSVYVVGGSYNGNGGGLTNLQATNIVFQDKVWSGTEVNDEGNAIIELNNGYQRYEWGANYFTITGITPAATGKPRWTSFKLLNTSLATMTLTISISNARAIGSASPFTIPDGKVAWITIHDDGQGTAWSITYAVAIEP